MQWVYLHGKHASSLDTRPEIYYVPWITIVSMTPRSTLARSWQNASIFKVSFSAVLQLRFFFSKNISRGFNLSKVTCPIFSVSSASNCSGIFISSPRSPPINHVGNLWIAVLTDPRAIEAANLGLSNDKSPGPKCPEVKESICLSLVFGKAWREKNRWFPTPPHPKLTNVP